MHKIRQLLRYFIGSIFGLILFAAALGYLLRDINLIFFWFMHIPVLLVALPALVFDLLARGCSLPFKPPYLVSILAVILWIYAGLDIHGNGYQRVAADENKPNIRVLHWNVNWGGGKYQQGLAKGIDYESLWASLIDSINKQQADIVILSEPPQDKVRLAQLLEALGADWHLLRAESQRSPIYRPRDKMAILSRWVLADVENRLLPNGEALLAAVETPQRPVQLLVVDGRRDLQQTRHALLSGVTQLVQDLQQQGRSIDIIAGDFNAIARSRGFDAFANLLGGFHLAGRASYSWRGTWLSTLPLYDIDHIWVHHDLAITHSTFITNWASDHRGQTVTLQLRSNTSE